MLNLLLGFILAILVSLVSFKLKLLTKSGALATFFLAWIIFGFGQLKWTIPILTFFILSSWLSKLRKKINPKLELAFHKTDERDHIQVLANGGFPGLLVIIDQIQTSKLFYVAYVSAIAAVCSDTWSTEIGTLFQAKTYNIINIIPVEPGVSGGISFNGLLGAVLGALVILLSSLPWLNADFQILSIIVVSGFLASVFDSILGSTIQAKLTCVICKKTIESKHHCGELAVHKRGIRWFNNDIVNFGASVFGGLFSVLLAINIL